MVRREQKRGESQPTWTWNFCRQSFMFCVSSPHALLKSFFNTRWSISRLSAFCEERENDALPVDKTRAYLIQFMIHVGLISFCLIQLLNQLSQRLGAIEYVDNACPPKINSLRCLEHLNCLCWSGPEWVASSDPVHHVAVVAQLGNPTGHSNDRAMTRNQACKHTDTPMVSTTCIGGSLLISWTGIAPERS